MSQYCRWCDKQYTAISRHQIYCSVECRNASTKDKLAERAKKAKMKRRMAKKRFCSGCGCEMSIYNEGSICSSCTIDKKRVDKFLKDMRYLFDYEKE
jgi:hypothetical protein